MKFLRNCAVLAVVLAALCLLFVPAQAAEIVASGECGADDSNVTWTLDADGLLTISGTGAMEDFTSYREGYTTKYTIPWYSLKDSVAQVVIHPGVTSIGNNAFLYCYYLTSIQLPDTITVIGSSAFGYCSELTSVDIPAGVTEIRGSAFYSSGITSAVIPEGVTTISGGMFSDCTNLTSVTIPESVTAIEGGAFSWCSKLKTLIIPDSVTSLGESMCAMSTGLEYVYIGKGVTEIDPATFSTIFNYCTSLEKFEVSPENHDYCTDEYGVLFNKDMTELILAPSAMTGIYYVPDGVVTLRDMAFCRNYGLTGVVLSDSVREIGSWSLGYSNMTQITLNEGLTTIADTAFRYSEKLESIVIPGTVQNLGEYTFQLCTALRSVTICEGVPYLPAYMFQECRSLEEVTIPASVTSIQSGAFSYCTNLKTVRYTGSKLQWFLLPKNNSMIGSDVTVLAHKHSFSGGTCTQCGEIGGTVGDQLVWSMADGTLMIECEGAIPNFSSASLAPWYSVRGEVQQLLFDTTVSDIGDYAFYGFENITQLTLPTQTTYIGNHAFDGCAALKNIDLSNQVISVGDYAFANCTAIYSVHLGANVSSIGQRAFANCPGLTAFRVSADNPFYAEHGATNMYYWLLTKDKSTLVFCCQIPSGEITVPYGVTTIADYAIADCSKVTRINLPETLTTIGEGIIVGCSSLETISYAGAEAQWEKIAIGKNNEDLADDMVICAASHAHTTENGQCAVCGVWIGTCGAQDSNLRWTLDTYGTMRIFGNGAMADYSSHYNTPWYSHRNKIKRVFIEYGVTSIGTSAFEYAASLTSVSISNSVTALRDSAFERCSSLISVNLPNSIKTIGSSVFTNCKNLHSITIPGSVTVIGAAAFSSCSGLSSLTLCNGITTIEHSAFQGCTSLTSVTLPDSLTSLRYWAFWGCTGLSSVTFSNKLTSISDAAFSGCRSLTSVTIPDSVTYIGENAFYDCTGLTTLVLPRNLRTISEHAFDSCTSLTSVILPERITTIGAYAFMDCSGLKSITIPASVTSIKKSAFVNCTSLTDVYYAGTEKKWSSIQIETNNTPLTNATIHCHEHSFENGACTGCGIIGGSCGANGAPVFWTLGADGLLTVYGEGAMLDMPYPIWLNYHRDVKTAVIEAGVTTIGASAFSMCDNMTSISIADTVTAIGNRAFGNCESLTSVTIPKNVNSIAYNAFEGCTSLTAIKVASGNADYSADSKGALYNKDKTLLILVPARLSGKYTVAKTTVRIGANAFVFNQNLTEIVIPDSVTVIESFAISNCASLESIKLGNGVSEIGAFAFGYCPKLTTVFFSSGLTTIGENVFDGCTSLTQLYYAGTEEQWKAIHCNASNSALDKLTVLHNAVLSIAVQPKNAMAKLDQSVQFTVEATGYGLTYQWMFSRDGGKTWNNSSAATAGYNTNTLTVVVTETRNGFMYRCYIRDELGNAVTSNAVQLTVGEPFAIVTQPADEAVKFGESTVLTVEATGNGLVYQWQYSLNGGKTWFNSTAATQGYNTDTLTVVGKQNRDGFLYRCRITDSKGEKLYSEAATLSVDISTMPKFTAQPASQAVAVGSKTVFSASFTGEYARVYWQYSIDGGRSWYASTFSGCDTDALTVEAQDFRDGFMYRCVLIDAYGNRTVSDAATLTVQ